MNCPNAADDEVYRQIVDNLDWSHPKGCIASLRDLVNRDHVEAMGLLAIILGDVDSKHYRDEIISLNERAFELGSAVAAENLAIQYEKWGEAFLSQLWRLRVKK